MLSIDFLCLRQLIGKPAKLAIVKKLLMSAMLLAFTCQAFAQTFYIREGADGQGTSWEDATGDLALILEQAQPGTEIWVAQGTYFPTTNSDRTKSFILSDGVRLLGGFAGSENCSSKRNPNKNKTILSGEIGIAGVSDNSYNVLFIHKASAETILDGFIITGGNANGNVGEANRLRSGGAVYNDGTFGNSSPQIRNCVFLRNYAREGAAVYNNARNGKIEVLFENCAFIQNEAGLDGGAVYNDGKSRGQCNPTFVNCSFERNVGTYGGAICNSSESGSCSIVINNCTFRENAAFLRGGAVFSLNGDERVFLEIVNTEFNGNYPDDQNMIFVTSFGQSKAYKATGMTP